MCLFVFDMAVARAYLIRVSVLMFCLCIVDEMCLDHVSVQMCIFDINYHFDGSRHGGNPLELEILSSCRSQFLVMFCRVVVHGQTRAMAAYRQRIARSHGISGYGSPMGLGLGDPPKIQQRCPAITRGPPLSASWEPRYPGGGGWCEIGRFTLPRPPPNLTRTQLVTPRDPTLFHRFEAQAPRSSMS